MEQMTSEKNKMLLVIDGYKFCFHKLLKSDLQRWRCTRTSCKSFIKINNDTEIIECKINHNHEKLETPVLNRQKMSNILKRKAIDNVCERPCKLIHNELSKEDVETLTSYDVSRIRDNMYQARAHILPKLPKSIFDVHEIIENLQIISNRGENMIFFNDRQHNIIGFSCSTNLELLAKSEIWFMDGTFKSAPKFFYQMFTIHTVKNEQYIPLLFILLPNKRQESYFVAFQHIKKYFIDLNITLNVQRILVDFEISIHSAIIDVWPTIEIKGCRFHLGQSWWRKIQELGLSAEYKDQSSEISKFLKYVFGLPFLNPDEVENAFVFDLMSCDVSNNFEVLKFATYLMDNYVMNYALFPPRLWAESSNSMLRTTNSCEAFHSKFNSMFYSSHPNIFQFIEVIKNVQCDVYIKIRSTGLLSKITRDKYLFLSHKLNAYKNGQISRFEFIKTVSFKFLPNV